MSGRPAGADDAVHMQRALELAERGWGRVAPNPLVGAVVVRNGTVVGEGWHAEYGGPHAEVAAIQEAGEAARGATIYVTLEPCAHHGKTGPCTETIRAAGIERVVFACSDPNPLAHGGAETLRAAGIEVLQGLEEWQARKLNASFFHRHTDRSAQRPWTELKLALSLDGRIADLHGRSSWITGEEARAEVHRLRAGSDAIAVGVRTVLVDDPLLTARGPVKPRNPPVRLIFDRNLSLPLDSRLVHSVSEAPIWDICGADAPRAARQSLEAAGIRVVVADDLSSAMRTIAESGLNSVFFEGGAKLASALLGEQLVDRLILFYAPLFLGADGAAPFRELSSKPLDEAHRWHRVRTRSFASDTMIVLDH